MYHWGHYIHVGDFDNWFAVYIQLQGAPLLCLVVCIQASCLVLYFLLYT